MSRLESDTLDIAEAFVEARLEAQSLAQYPGAVPTDLAQAYAVQDRAIPLFDDQVAGWKVGRVNSPWLEKLGVSRLAGPIFRRNISPVNESESATGQIFSGGFGAAEAEFVFRIGRAPQQGQTTFTVEDAAELVDSVFCGIEIASSPFPGINALGPLVTISDFGNNNGLLLGPEIPDWRISRFEDWELTMLVDDVAVGGATAAAFPGGLMESVRFLVENLVARGLPITPGLLISSGAVTGVHEVGVGSRVRTRFGEYCTLDCVIDHAAPKHIG